MAFAKLPPQPGTHHGPFALGRPLRQSQYSSRFDNAQAPKESQFHQLSLPGVDLCQLRQGLVHGQDIVVGLKGGHKVVLQQQAVLLAAAFGSTTPPRVIDKYSAHSLGRQGKEVRTPLPIDSRLIHEFQVHLVHQGRRLKRNPFRLLAEKPAGQVSQLLINGCKQAIDC